MRKRKRKTVGIRASVLNKGALSEQIRNASEGLYYTSETDAEITPFIGEKAESVSKEEILRQTNHSLDTPVEERNFSEIFQRLIEIQDWYGDEETAIANKYTALKNLLEKNLKDLKIYKIGKIELDIYFVGINHEGVLMGVKTKAVET